MASVEFDHVFKIYPNGYTAIKDLSLTIQNGEFLVFVGPSGCGKSTAMRMVAGLEDISAGKLKIGDEVMNDRTPQQRNVAMVFQNYALYPHMTVQQNLDFPLRMMNCPKAERQQRVQDAAQKLGLEPLLDRRPKALSGGQRQRVAMGRAIVRDPAVFLMDEPLSNLDAKMRVQIRSEITQLQRQMGTTMVYVTHDQVEAMTMGDRVAVMRSGELQQVAPPQALYEHPANIFVASFIGSPAMNIFHSQLSHPDGDSLSVDIAGQLFALSQHQSQHLSRHSGPILAGLRPEAFYRPGTLVSQGQPLLQVTVMTVEALGHEMIVYFEAPVAKVEVDESDRPGADVAPQSNPTAILLARLPSSPDIYPGAALQLAVDTQKLYCFTPAGIAL